MLQRRLCLVNITAGRRAGLGSRASGYARELSARTSCASGRPFTKFGRLNALIGINSMARRGRLCRHNGHGRSHRPPLLLAFSPHCRCVRVLRLDPVPRAARTAPRVAPLRYDTFETELTCVTKDERAIFLIEMLIELQSRRGSSQHFGQGSVRN
jgi:hypothetical protein